MMKIVVRVSVSIGGKKSKRATRAVAAAILAALAYFLA